MVITVPVLDAIFFICPIPVPNVIIITLLAHTLVPHDLSVSVKVELPPLSAVPEHNEVVPQAGQKLRVSKVTGPDESGVHHVYYEHDTERVASWNERYAMKQKDFEQAWRGTPTSAEDLIGKYCSQCASRLPNPAGKFCDQCGFSLGGQVL